VRLDIDRMDDDDKSPIRVTAQISWVADPVLQVDDQERGFMPVKNQSPQ